jgi:replicative DNA helicase
MVTMQLRAEQLVINAVLSDPGSIHSIMASVSADMFEGQETKLIFSCISEMYINGKPINLISVYQELSKVKSLLKASALSSLSGIYSMFTSIEKLEIRSAISLLISESVRNEHIELGNDIRKAAESTAYDPSEILDKIQNHILDNKYKAILNKKEYSNSLLLDELDQKMIDASQHGGINGIRTGYERYDKVTSGMQPTNFIVIAGRPAMGKTQYALGIIKTASIRGNEKGLFISCEMDEVQVMKRIISVDSGVPGYSIKRGRLDKSEVLRFERSKERIRNANFKIVAGSFTISDVLSLVYKMKHSEGLDYVIIDYIQKIQSPGSQNRTNEVGDVSRRLKDMANDLKIPVIALAQLSRAVEHRVDKKPILSDLRESGDIEQDADIVMFLYRPGYYMEQDERMNNPMAEDGYALIAKHRDGELEDIVMKFKAEIPAWTNPYKDDYAEDNYVQTNLTPNGDFDYQGSQPF